MHVRLVREQLLTTQPREINAKVFAEDQAIVEAQQHVLESYATRAMGNLNIDADSMRAWGIIEDMIEAEARNAAA